MASLQAQLAAVREESQVLRTARDDLARQLQQQQDAAMAATDGSLVSALEQQLADLRQQQAAVDPQQLAFQVGRAATQSALAYHTGHVLVMMVLSAVLPVCASKHPPASNVYGRPPLGAPSPHLHALMSQPAAPGGQLQQVACWRIQGHAARVVDS
jgi:hypothetical protein